MIKCLICQKAYTKPLAHVWQKHEMTAREYKEHFGLDVKRGIIIPEHKERLRDNVINNGTIENLKKGKANRFKKGHKINYKRSVQTLKRLKEHWGRVADRQGRPRTIPKIKINCALCGKEKEIYPRYLKTNNNYCSILCRNRRANKIND